MYQWYSSTMVPVRMYYVLPCGSTKVLVFQVVFEIIWHICTYTYIMDHHWYMCTVRTYVRSTYVPLGTIPGTPEYVHMYCTNGTIIGTRVHVVYVFTNGTMVAFSF